MNFKNKNVLIIGDVMLDSYIFGNVDRISPEAPVPVVDIVRKQNKLGGAANVAANIKTLGGTPFLCSVIGKDQTGSIFISELKKLKISSEYILQSVNRITTDKKRVIGNNHQMLRIDEEIKNELNIDDQKYIISSVNRILKNKKIDVILFSDYDKGVLNEFIINKIIKNANNINIPIIADPKNKNFTHYKNITLFKPNFKELKEGLNINTNNKIEVLEQGSRFLHKQGIKIVVVTLSDEGIFLSYNNGEISKIIPPKSKINVVDVSGAGDTVASIICMMLGDNDIEEIVKISNLAGGIVCEEIGVVSININKL